MFAAGAAQEWQEERHRSVSLSSPNHTLSVVVTSDSSTPNDNCVCDPTVELARVTQQDLMSALVVGLIYVNWTWPALDPVVQRLTEREGLVGDRIPPT